MVINKLIGLRIYSVQRRIRQWAQEYTIHPLIENCIAMNQCFFIHWFGAVMMVPFTPVPMALLPEHQPDLIKPKVEDSYDGY